MRIAVMAIVLGMMVAAPAAAQQWEYGRLGLTGSVPAGWSAGDSSGNAIGLIRAAEQRERAAGLSRRSDLLISVMNELSAQGWEFVQSAPGVGLIFRRQRQP